jgi:protein-S-isoprenylcysteine O-methyltransferase Ste14
MRQRDRGASRVTLLTWLLFAGAVTLLTVRMAGYLATGSPARLVCALLAAGYLAWLLIETPVTFSALSRPAPGRPAPGRPAAESRTLAAYAAARMLLVILAVLPAPPWAAWSPWMVPPIVVFASGVALRVAAIRALGAGYTHHVVHPGERSLVTTGPYRFIRHPAYAGMLAANLGFALFFRSVPSALAWLALLAALIWRIRVEERVLWSVPGYPEFAAGRPRLLAGVW